ncbi:MFS transporter [Streptomyces sp. NPDC002671]
MRHLWRQTLSFPSAVRLLMANQFLINLAFYMLMPYLAAHLAGELGLAAWAVGLVLGVRNFSQQGMFLIGGTLADRLGYKTPIMAGLLLRTVGFGLLGWVGDLPTLVVASAATGFAGALFNPAVRAYVAVEAGPRRVDAFALFNVYYQAGMLLGPPLGLALLAADFRLVCGVAAAVFVLLTALQWRCLPTRRAERAEPGTGRAGVLSDWRTVVSNRPFLLFAAAMTGSYVLTFQVYLALPLAASDVLGSGGTAVTSGLFVVSAAVSAVGQLRLTGWAKQRWRPAQALVRGLAAMGLAFVPPALVPAGSAPAALVALLLSVVLLAVGGAIVYPFEMDTVVTLSGDRLVATHYGFYNTVSGIGITVGNLGTGALWGFAGQHDVRWLAWSALALTGLGGAACVGCLSRTGRLAVPTAQPVAA